MRAEGQRDEGRRGGGGRLEEWPMQRGESVLQGL